MVNLDGLLSLVLSGLEVLPGEEYEGENNEEAKERDNYDDWKKIHISGEVKGRRELSFCLKKKQEIKMTFICHLT